MSFFDKVGNFLGKASSTKSESRTSEQSRVDIPEWLRSSVEPLYTKAGSLGQSIANQSYSRYQGPRVAPANLGMKYGIAGLNRAPNSGAYTQPNVQKASYGLTMRNLRGDNLKGNPYLQDVINSTNRGVTENYMKSMRPQMDANLARQGAFGGSGWATANRDMESELARQLAENEGGMRYNNYATERGYQQQAINDAMGLQDQDLQRQGQRERAYQNQFSANQILQGIQQREMDINNEDFIEQRDWLFRALQGLNSSLAPMSSMYGQQSKGSGGGSGLAGVMGGAGQLLSGWGAMK
jgi:hypothetical protein